MPTSKFNRSVSVQEYFIKKIDQDVGIISFPELNVECESSVMKNNDKTFVKCKQHSNKETPGRERKGTG